MCSIEQHKERAPEYIYRTIKRENPQQVMFFPRVEHQYTSDYLDDYSGEHSEDDRFASVLVLSFCFNMCDSSLSFVRMFPFNPCCSRDHNQL